MIPFWKGPEEEGITQSLLGRFLVCKERFRLLTIEGVRPIERFSPALEYGNMWHICEEELAAERDWNKPLLDYSNELLKKFPQNKTDINKWAAVCQVQFPYYVKYWRNESETKRRTPLVQEQVFKLPYELPSGRIVYMKGKFDSVDVIGNGKKAAYWLQENKTKGIVDPPTISRQLTFDLQVMFYNIALREYCKSEKTKMKVKGVRFNTVRRPLSSGKGSIRPRKATKNNPEETWTSPSFLERLEQYFIDDPADWFNRWTVEITDKDVENFKESFLDPCLEHLCLWYDYHTKEEIELCDMDFLHYRTPFGLYHNVGEGGEIEEYMISGSTVGLEKATTLFPEL